MEGHESAEGERTAEDRRTVEAGTVEVRGNAEAQMEVGDAAVVHRKKAPGVEARGDGGGAAQTEEAGAEEVLDRTDPEAEVQRQ